MTGLSPDELSSSENSVVIALTVEREYSFFGSFVGFFPGMVNILVVKISVVV